MVWYSHLFKNFPHFVVIHTVKGFSIVSGANVFLESLPSQVITVIYQEFNAHQIITNRYVYLLPIEAGGSDSVKGSQGGSWRLRARSLLQ